MRVIPQFLKVVRLLIYLFLGGGLNGFPNG